MVDLSKRLFNQVQTLTRGDAIASSLNFGNTILHVALKGVASEEVISVEQKIQIEF